MTIPFYAGKITWAINGKNTFTASTFGDFTKIDGFLATGALSITVQSVAVPGKPVRGSARASKRVGEPW